MMFDLPSHDELYRSLEKRDGRFEGRAFVGVSSTGVFCRMPCPARTPKSQNCQFYSSVGECVRAGFRPCKRCHPLKTAADADPTIQSLLQEMEARFQHRWSEQDIVDLGHDPSTVRRAFNRQFGMTFLEMARHKRVREGFETLSKGGQVIEAQLDAGFASPSAFRSAFAKLLGASPASFVADAPFQADWFDTPLGAMIGVSDKEKLHLLEFTDRKSLSTQLKKLRKNLDGPLGIGSLAPTKIVRAQLAAFFEGRSADFSVPIAMHGTEFTQSVWRALRKIPVGVTKSYGEVAKEIGNQMAVRAVAKANGANQIAIVIPCHRVIGADGTLTGYAGGLWRKQKLIDIESKFRNSKKERKNDTI